MSDQMPPIQKVGAPVTISTDAAMDYGLIPDTRPPVAIPWRTRLRWRVADRWWAARRAVGFRIAGVDPGAYE